MAPLKGIPEDTTVISLIVEKTLKTCMTAEVYLVKTPRQYEAALFVDGNYKPGPPVPRELEPPANPQALYWMGVRPKIGLSKEEGEEILATVNVQNRMHHCHFVDSWGADAI